MVCGVEQIQVFWNFCFKKYADKVDELVDYTDQEKKEYLEGIVDRIDVRLDKETNDHHLDVVFRLRLVDDGIQYLDENNKSAGYEIIQGKNIQPITVEHSVVKSRGAIARKVGRQEQNAQKKRPESTYHLTPHEHHSGITENMQASGIGYWPVPVKVTASHCWYPHGCDDKKTRPEKDMSSKSRVFFPF